MAESQERNIKPYDFKKNVEEWGSHEDLAKDKVVQFTKNIKTVKFVCL